MSQLRLPGRHADVRPPSVTQTYPRRTDGELALGRWMSRTFDGSKLWEFLLGVVKADRGEKTQDWGKPQLIEAETMD